MRNETSIMFTIIFFLSIRRINTICSYIIIVLCHMRLGIIVLCHTRLGIIVLCHTRLGIRHLVNLSGLSEPRQENGIFIVLLFSNNVTVSLFAEIIFSDKTIPSPLSENTLSMRSLDCNKTKHTIMYIDACRRLVLYLLV